MNVKIGIMFCNIILGVVWVRLVIIKRVLFVIWVFEEFCM